MPAQRIPAKPTLYGGYQMRSRLEARWAAMLDELGWEWRYEPCYLDDWLPDFEVKVHCLKPRCDIKVHKVVCEVRPYATRTQFNSHKASKRIRQKPHDDIALLGSAWNSCWFYLRMCCGNKGQTLSNLMSRHSETGQAEHRRHFLMRRWEDAQAQVRAAVEHEQRQAKPTPRESIGRKPAARVLEDHWYRL